MEFQTMPDLKLHSVQIEFSLRAEGNMRSTGGDEAMKNREIFVKERLSRYTLAKMAQVCHGEKIEIVRKGSPKIIPKTEAFITQIPGLFIAVTFADCAPVFLYDPDERVAAVAHCSYKTLLDKNILHKTIIGMRGLRAWPGNIIAVIGPGICKKCYEIQIGVWPMYLGYTEYIRNENGRFFANLRAIIFKKLRESGIRRENIYDIELCTCCGKDKDTGEPTFFSARREKMQEPNIQTGIAGIQLL